MLILVCAVATVVAAACGGDDAAAGVTIEQFAFSPPQIRVAPGTTVRWQNGDTFRHTVTSGDTAGPENVPDGRFDEDLPDKGSIGEVTFDQSGTFAYYCRQHNAMNGLVVVT